MHYLHLKKGMALLLLVLSIASTSCSTTPSDSEARATQEPPQQAAVDYPVAVDTTTAAESVPAETTIPTETTVPTETTAPTETTTPEITSATAYESTADPGTLAEEWGYSLPAAGGTASVVSNFVRSDDEYIRLMNGLNDIVWNYRNVLSFSYENLENGCTISYNDKKKYNSCSTIKAPYVKCLLSTQPDLSTQVVMKRSDLNDYSGCVEGKPVGTSFDVLNLIYHTLVYSNNTSYNMLFRTYSYKDFNTLSYNLGLSTRLGSAYWYCRVTSYDMKTYFKDIYSYIKNESPNYQLLCDYLSDCDYNEQIGYALGDRWEVLQKYGSQDSTVDFHDCAIVYADSPYVLTIMTNLPQSEEKSLLPFRLLAIQIDEINSLIAPKKGPVETAPVSSAPDELREN